MCLIGVAIDVPGPWMLVIASNRDEFHNRPTTPAHYWDAPEARGPGAGQHDEPKDDDAILAGRDLRGGGTWLGMRWGMAGEPMRVAALTNLRPGLMPERGGAGDAVATPPSRGHLVTAFLAAEATPEVFLDGLLPPPDAYPGFNLITLTAAGTGTPAASVDAWYLNNLPHSPRQRLGGGIHLVSNATLGVPWSKTVRLRASLSAALDHATDPVTLQALLFRALDDRTPASNGELPSTGLPPARERQLSAPFIVDDSYGTRCSTLIIVTRDGGGVFCERSFDRAGRQSGQVTESFSLLGG